MLALVIVSGSACTKSGDTKALAERGQANAQLNLGYMYDTGKGVAQNDAEAVKWYQRAADQGLALAQGTLGAMYAKGRGVPQNDLEAVKWYRRAAEQGGPQAQFDIGLMYATGQGVAQNDVQAYKWWNLAAAQGNQNAKTQKAIVEKKMTREQIADAQKLSAEWKPTK